MSNNYGDLQGATLQSQELPVLSATPLNEPLIVLSNSSTQMSSPITANSPDTTNPFAENCPTFDSGAQNIPSQNIPAQISPNQNPSPYSPPIPKPLGEDNIPVNIKGILMEFCGKNKLQLPTFRREAPHSGSYSAVINWSSPNSEVIFEEKVTYSNKRDAENKVSSLMLAHIKDWMTNNPQVDVGDAKGQLQRILSLNSTKFSQPKYSTESKGIRLFSSILTVSDSLGEEHRTDGGGVSKKTAEKEAASKMIPILSELISLKRKSESTDEFRNDIDRLEAKRAVSTFSDYQIEYLPCQQENMGMKYILQSCSLILRKENFPSIVVATSSGLQLEEAQLACAKLALQHFVSIKKVIDERPK